MKKNQTDERNIKDLNTKIETIKKTQTEEIRETENMGK